MKKQSLRFSLCLLLLAGLFSVNISSAKADVAKNPPIDCPNRHLPDFLGGNELNTTMQVVRFIAPKKELKLAAAVYLPELLSGLSCVENVPPNTGMIFVFHQMREWTFEMRNTRVPLDIAFISDDGTIMNVYEKLPPGYGNSHPAKRSGKGMYVVEMPSGTARRAGMYPGRIVIIPRFHIIP